VNATATDRENARAVMLDRAAMAALVEACLAGNDVSAHEDMLLCVEEYNAGAPAVNIRTGKVEYATGVRPVLGTGVFRSIIG
jgi:hypothetical protein